MRFVDYAISPVKEQDGFVHPKMNSPLTEASRLRADRTTGMFMRGSEVVPLFGVNMGYSLVDHAGVFRFMASIGINFVRVIVPFRTWGASGVTRPRTTVLDFDEKTFQKLCKQQYEAEKNGIYILLSDFCLGLSDPHLPLVDAREVPDFFDSYDATSIGLWHSGVKRAAFERIKRLLRRENPFTKKPFGVSPALMGIQLTNEMMWYVGHFETRDSDRWKRIIKLAEKPGSPVHEALGKDVAQLKSMSPSERVLHLADASGRIHKEAVEILKEVCGDKKPMLIADNAPHAGGAAFRAFEGCDGFGWNLYPFAGNYGGVTSLIKAHDLSNEVSLARLQTRYAGIPMVLTETGERLSTGGYSRLIADITVRLSRFGYAGVCFHQMFRGNYGEASGEERFLASRAPLDNYELSTDPGALCALHACSVIFRKRLISIAPKSVEVSAPPSRLLENAVKGSYQIEDLRAAAALDSRAKDELGNINTCIFVKSGISSTSVKQASAVDTVQLKHVRAKDVEIDWETNANPEQDWVFIRVKLDKGRSLLVLLGRSKPEPAIQTFLSGVASLSGFKQYSWPDPRTGYGEKQVVRRPVGPMVRVEGKLFVVLPDGKRGDEVVINNRAESMLPTDGIRWSEVFPSSVIW